MRGEKLKETLCLCLYFKEEIIDIWFPSKNNLYCRKKIFYVTNVVLISQTLHSSVLLPSDVRLMCKP